MNQFDPKKIQDEIEWLRKHPWFNEKPSSIREFIGVGYLQLDMPGKNKVRPGVRAELIKIFGEETNPHRIAVFDKAMFTGAIGIGKTTMASIVIPYMCHWILCLKDPQDYYELLPGSRIAFMQMSTSADQAVETVFGDIKARIQHSPWFINNFPFDPKFTKQIRFDKDIWILPGSSLETAFEGYNILGGILDEADSHKQTKDKDYADVGYEAIENRISSRFGDQGFLLVVGQMKKASGFAKKKFDEFQKRSDAHTVRMTIWESFGWDKYLKADGTRDSFWYDIKRKNIIPTGSAQILLGEGEGDHLLEVPTKYLENFRTKPEKALRDLAGIPPAAGDPFISLIYKVEEAIERWEENNPGLPSPVDSNPTRPRFADWFRATTPLKRVVHVDFAYSAEGDALGMSMGHISHLVESDEGEEKPYIKIDFMMRIKAAPGTEIMFSDIRRMIYDLKEIMGFRIRTVSMDGFQSTDTKQQLRKKKFHTEYISVDKSKLPYEDLRDAFYENRIEMPPYLVHLNYGDRDTVQIALKELQELEEDDRKVDHPSSGSKDVADTLAGIVTVLMGDRTYRRGVRSQANGNDEDDPYNPTQSQSGYRTNQSRLSSMMPSGLSAPVPPSSVPGFDFSFPIPPGLSPGRDRQ